MLEKILAPVAAAIIAVISAGGYVGITLLMAIESACIPLPSEIIMPFSGYLVSTGELGLFAVATAGAIGCNLGLIPAYALGKYGGRPAVERFGRYVLMNVHDLDRAERFFDRFGSAAVFIGRLLPIIRSFIAFPAGMARMRQVPFHIYTFLGSWPWCFALAWIGMKLGERWHDDPRVGRVLHSLDVVIVVALLGGVGYYLWHRLRGYERKWP
jgi:membrane protein DedA with SNARE-associated domain